MLRLFLLPRANQFSHFQLIQNSEQTSERFKIVRMPSQGRNQTLRHPVAGEWSHGGRKGQIDLVHGLSTSRPSAERETQGRLLPVGNSAGLSFLTHGSEDSRPSWRQRRTVLTFVQHFSNSLNTSARRL